MLDAASNRAWAYSAHVPLRTIRFWASTLPATLTWPLLHVRVVAETAEVDPGKAWATARRTNVVLVLPTTPPNEIDAITTAGSQSRYHPPGGDSSEINYGIGNIAPGADGRLWFAVGGGNAGAMGAISTGGKVSVPPTNGKGTLPGHSICVVPRLIGKKLAVARRALSAAHCRLGKVSKRKHRGTPGRVLSQRPKPGTKRPASSKVTVVESRR